MHDRAEFDHPTRGKSYSHANSELPHVRSAEIDGALQLLNPQEGEVILEFGAGNGILTRKILPLVGETGQLLATDNSQFVIKQLRERLPRVSSMRLGVDDSLPVPSGACDAVVSLANIHHVAGKARMFGEFSRVLRPGGRLIVVDVADNTPVQAYFDDVVDRICSTGHKHVFLDEVSCQQLCQSVGLDVLSWDLRQVPWEFSGPSTESTAGWFLKKIHDASCTADQCYAEASRSLGFDELEGGGLLLNWQLFFMHATKPND